MRPDDELVEAMNDGPTEARSLYGVRPFGNYVLVRKLAVGGMAEIHLAKQVGVEGFERNVVIKQMLPHLALQPEFVDMFLDEARLASRLVHPNIVPIYELGSAEGTYYICMEYLPGEDLSWILRQSRARQLPIPVDVAVRIAIEAAHGLEYAHDLADLDGRPLNIVHRDVSPGNIVVGYEGEIKVLDFGIAKAESRVTSTEIGTVKGKILYMSPEQSRAEPIDRRADVYSLGVTLYEVLTAARPFGRDSPQGVFDAVTRGDFEPLRQRRPELSEELERIVHKAMARDVADRYASCGAFATDLEQVLDAATPTGHTAAVGRFLRDLCGADEIALKTRIPTLASLQRTQPSAPEARRPDDKSEPQQPTRAGIKSPPEPRRTLQVVAAAVGTLGLIATAFIARHSLPVPPGCNQHYGSDAPDAIVIGAVLPLSINQQPEDGQIQLLNAMRLALDEINQRDGVAGRSIRLDVCDNGSEVANTKTQATWLIDERHVPAIVTSWSSATLAAANITVPRGVLAITADATSPELAAVPATVEGVRMLWRTAPSDAMQGRVLAELLAHDPAFENLSRIGVLYQDDPYGQGLAGVVAQQLAHIAPKIEVRSIQYPLRGDINQQVVQLAAFKPELTLLVGFPLDAKRIVERAYEEPVLTRAHGHHWFFSDSVKEPTLFIGLAHPEEIDGAYGLEAADGGGDEATSFQARFLTKYHRNVIDQTYSSNRYDAIYLLALAAAHALGSDGKGALTGVRMARGLTHISSGKRFGLTPEQFTAARAELQSSGSINVTGASGELDFDNRIGEAHAAFSVWRIVGRTFVKDRRIAIDSPRDAEAK